MAAAGLVVALVSVVSFSTLDRRIEDKFQRLVKQSEEEQRTKTNAMFQGFALQLQSVNNGDLYKAESLLEEAFKVYPDLPDSRRQLALRFYESTERSYIGKLVPDKRFVFQRLPDGALAVGNHENLCKNFNPLLEDSYSYEAEKWLEKARDYGEDGDKLLSFALTKLYGIRGRFDLMLKCLSIVEDRLQQVTEEEMFRVICTCGAACQTEGQLLELFNILDRPIPLSQERVFSEMDSFKGDRSRPFVAFIGRRKPNTFASFNTPTVFQLKIYKHGESQYRLAFVGEHSHDIKWWPGEKDTEGSDTSLDRNEAWAVINNHCWLLTMVHV